MGEWGLAPTLFDLGAKVEVSGYYHASADFHPGKEPSVTIVQETGWAQEQEWTIWRSEKLLASAVKFGSFHENWAYRRKPHEEGTQRLLKLKHFAWITHLKWTVWRRKS
jgi:hypothetical protein